MSSEGFLSNVVHLLNHFLEILTFLTLIDVEMAGCSVESIDFCILRPSKKRNIKETSVKLLIYEYFKRVNVLIIDTQIFGFQLALKRDNNLHVSEYSK